MYEVSIAEEDQKSLMKAFIVMVRTIKSSYEELFLCVFLSIIWWVGHSGSIVMMFGLSQQSILLMILGIPLLVLAAPATVGLHRVANRIANYKRVDSSFFWEAARQNIGKGWLVYLIHIILPAAVTFNVWFYINAAPSVMRIIGVAWVWILLLILMFIQYLFPLFWQQDEPSIRMILRNAFLLALRYPLYTFLMFIFLILFGTLSAVLTLPLFLLAPAVLAIGANCSLVGVLQEMELAPQPPVISKYVGDPYSLS